MLENLPRQGLKMPHHHSRGKTAQGMVLVQAQSSQQKVGRKQEGPTKEPKTLHTHTNVIQMCMLGENWGKNGPKRTRKQLGKNVRQKQMALKNVW